MPRKKKYVSVKKYRKGARRFYRRKYMKKRKFKRTVRRLRGYHRKRKFNPVYKQRNYVGIKWTRYLTLPEFLKDDKWDLEWIYANAWPETVQGVDHYYIGNGFEFRPTFAEDMRTVTVRTWTVPSTEIMTNKFLKVPYNLPKYAIKWKAYSPTPSEHNLGPMFVQYCNLYKKMCYIGVKVKWKPGLVATSTIAPAMGGSIVTVGKSLTDNLNTFSVHDISTGATVAGQQVQGTARVGGVETDRVAMIPQLSTFADWNTKNINTDFVGFLNLPTGLMKTAETTLPAMQSPLDLRLWINFDKQGYEGFDFDPNPVAGYHVINPPTATAKIFNTRIRFREMWAENGSRKDVNSKLIKSYSLRKPFKFYVRPKIAKPLLENPENETVIRNAEDRTEVTSMISEQASSFTKLMDTNRRMQYVSVMQTQPTDSLGLRQLNPGQSEHQVTMAIYKALNQDLFFDPILFGWCLTCDNIPVNKNVDLFGIRKVNNWANDSNVAYLNKQIDIADQLLAMGKFKVTYYCKFKNFQHLILPEVLETMNAAAEEDEVPLSIPPYNPGPDA